MEGIGVQNKNNGDTNNNTLIQEIHMHLGKLDSNTLLALANAINKIPEKENIKEAIPIQIEG